MQKFNISSKSVDALFEKIEKISKVQRILIYCVSFIILIGSFIYLSYKPKFMKIHNLNEEYEKLEIQIARAKKNAKQLNKYRNMMKNAESQFRIAKKALPEKKEIPSLLSSISQSGQDAGLDFLLFQPKKEDIKDFYAEIPVAIQVIGNYHNVALFFDKVANLPRVVNIKDIKMVPSKDGSKLTTSCTAVTYKFVEAPSKVEAQSKKKK